MGKLKTQLEFEEEVFAQVGTDYSVLGRYEGAHEKLKIIHNICKFIYPVSPIKFLQGRRCPKCQNRYKRTNKEFKEEVFELVEGDYTVLGEFLGVDKRIEMRHNVCGHEYPVTPKHFLFSGSRCPKCFGKNKWTNVYFNERVFSEVGKEYTFLSEYKGYDVHILVRHNVCGNSYPVTPNKFLGGRTRCPTCQIIKSNEGKKKSDEEVTREVFERFGTEFSVISHYKGAFGPLTVLHSICNNELTISNAKNFLFGKGFCKYCDKGTRFSRGAKEISNFLMEKNVDFTMEYSFEDCVYKQVLFFDFAIFYKEKLMCLIEFDGQQHFEPVEIYDGLKGYIVNLTKDKIKNEYCEKKEIPLIRIAYDQIEELESMLIKYFDELGLKHVLY